MATPESETCCNWSIWNRIWKSLGLEMPTSRLELDLHTNICRSNKIWKHLNLESRPINCRTIKIYRKPKLEADNRKRTVLSLQSDAQIRSLWRTSASLRHRSIDISGKLFKSPPDWSETFGLWLIIISWCGGGTDQSDQRLSADSGGGSRKWFWTCPCSGLRRVLQSDGSFQFKTI